MNIGVKGSVDHQDFFADSNSLQGLKAGDVAQTKAGLQKVAKEFESLYLKMMMDLIDDNLKNGYVLSSSSKRVSKSTR